MTAPAAPGDGATATVFVAVAPDVAFEVFTREIDLWWRRGPKYRVAGQQRGQLNFEPGVGVRVFESFESEAGVHTFETGRVIAWDPPAGFELEWRGAAFQPGEKTLVSVRFEPARGGTLVSVRHRGWSALRPDHPVRHGLAGAEFSRMIGMWWSELLTALREHVARR